MFCCNVVTLSILFELCGILIKITSKHTQQYYPPKGRRGYLLFYIYYFICIPLKRHPSLANLQRKIINCPNNHTLLPDICT